MRSLLNLWEPIVDQLNLPAPPGFRGLRDDLPLTVYTRHLPHWRQDGATYFVTFRQADALPPETRHALQSMRLKWERRHPVPRSNTAWEELFKETWTLEEGSLDQNYGTCRLTTESAIQSVVDVMHFFDRHRHELNCYVIMSNHVHAVLKPLNPANEPLEKILQSWKRHTSRQINEICKTDGPFWQEESFDRIIRDEEHLYRCIQYIGRNPRKCGRTLESCRLWLRHDWQQLGWKFEQDVHAKPLSESFYRRTDL